MISEPRHLVAPEPRHRVEQGWAISTWALETGTNYRWMSIKYICVCVSILKEISPGFSLEGLMVKLKLQYFGHLMRRVDSLEKTLLLGGIGGRRRRGDRGWDGWMASPTQCTWVWVNFGSCWWTGRPGVLRFMGSQRVGHDWATKLNWMTWEKVIYQKTGKRMMSNKESPSTLN